MKDVSYIIIILVVAMLCLGCGSENRPTGVVRDSNMNFLWIFFVKDTIGMGMYLDNLLEEYQCLCWGCFSAYNRWRNIEQQHGAYNQKQQQQKTEPCAQVRLLRMYSSAIVNLTYSWATSSVKTIITASFKCMRIYEGIYIFLCNLIGLQKHWR